MITGCFVTTSEDETRTLARSLAQDIQAGATLLLSGDLGAGKTAFVRGLAEGLEIDPETVTSPTFTLVHEYRGGRLPLVHVDLYRLERVDLDEIGLDSEFANQGVIAIEWPDRLSRPVADAIRIHLIDAGDDARDISIGR